MPPATGITSDRTRSRVVLGSLSAVVLLVSLQPLLLPRQPRLPQLPADAPLPPGWQALASTGNAPAETPPLHPSPPPHRYRPFFNRMAVGGSTTLQGPQGARVRLTPLASWRPGDLDIASFGQPCLTVQGKLESEPSFRALIPSDPEPLSWPQKLLFILLPAGDRSFGCLLVSSNRPDLLASDQALWPALSRAIRWPPPPSF